MSKIKDLNSNCSLYKEKSRNISLFESGAKPKNINNLNKKEKLFILKFRPFHTEKTIKKIFLYEHEIDKFNNILKNKDNLNIIGKILYKFDILRKTKDDEIVEYFDDRYNFEDRMFEPLKEDSFGKPVCEYCSENIKGKYINFKQVINTDSDIKDPFLHIHIDCLREIIEEIEKIKTLAKI